MHCLEHLNTCTVKVYVYFLYIGCQSAGKIGYWMHIEPIAMDTIGFLDQFFSNGMYVLKISAIYIMMPCSQGSHMQIVKFNAAVVIRGGGSS